MYSGAQDKTMIYFNCFWPKTKPFRIWLIPNIKATRKGSAREGGPGIAGDGRLKERWERCLPEFLSLLPRSTHIKWTKLLQRKDKRNRNPITHASLGRIVNIYASMKENTCCSNTIQDFFFIVVCSSRWLNMRHLVCLFVPLHMINFLHHVIRFQGRNPI